ncbi:MAG: hypothetical protein CMJ86_07560 [Planctomycetes bacterium]|nr:hypothetical protein [Planctomycetota bacterium]
MTQVNSSSIRRDFLILALAAAATLLWEVLVTRICALRLAFHYGFLIVSNGLLGLGAAGSLLFALRTRIQGREDLWLRRFLWLSALSLPLAYLWMVRFPIDPDVRFGTMGAALPFLFYNLGAALPFATGGLVIGLLLVRHGSRIHKAYCADLLGAAVGALSCPLLLWWVGAGGAGCVAAAIFFGALVLAYGPHSISQVIRGRALVPWVGFLGLIILTPSAERLLPIPSSNEVRLARGQEVRLGEKKVYSRWSALSRVDVYQVEPEERSMFMPGRKVTGYPEEQLFIAQDSSSGTFMHDFSGSPEGRANLSRSLYSLGTTVLGAKSVFIIGAGGGCDLWGALEGGATRIKAVELNRQIVDLHESVYSGYSEDLLNEPGVELVHAEGRAALIREEERFDLLQMSGIDTWTALASGAYMLAENFLYTSDAVRDMFAVLNQGGSVQLTRLSGDVEVLRLLGTVHDAWQEVGSGAFEDCVAVVHAADFAAILCRREPFTRGQLDRLLVYLADAGMDASYFPGQRVGGLVEELVLAQDKPAFQAGASARIDPVGDDRPFFFHFTRFTDWASARELIDAPASQVQGNPLFMLIQLAFALVMSVLLLGLPLLGKRRASGGPRLAVLGYFLSLGLGFIFIEVTLMQELVLIVGHPVFSIAITLTAILIATGVGSLISRRWFCHARAPFWLVPAALLLLVVAWNEMGPEIVRFAGHLPSGLRLMMGGLVVVPFGLVLGIPFSHGIALLHKSGPDLVPWAWAINAAGTVLGAIIAAIGSMELGFSNVLLAGAACYLLALVAQQGLARNPVP